MALSHITKRYGVSDAKIYPVTTDTADGYAFGNGIDVPGIKSVTIEAATTTKELRGDNQQLDSLLALTGITGTIAFAKESLDVTAAALGLTVTDSGSAPNQVATLSVLGTSTPQPLRLEAVAAASDFIGGDAVMILPKITMVPLVGLAEEDYATVSVSYTAAAAVFDGKWVDIQYRQTTAALSV